MDDGLWRVWGKDDGMERFWKGDGEARLFACLLGEEKGGC